MKDNHRSVFVMEEKKPVQKALMTPPELADYLGIGRNAAYKLLNEGIIQGFRIGSQWKVSKDAVDLYIARSSGLL